MNRSRLPEERRDEVQRKVRLVNVSGVDHVIPPVPAADWFGRVTLRSGCTLDVPEGVVTHCYQTHRRYPADSWETAVRSRLIAVTEVRS